MSNELKCIKCRKNMIFTELDGLCIECQGKEFEAEGKERKIKLIQQKGLFHKLYMLTHCGSEQPTPEEAEQLAEMIMRRINSDELDRIIAS